MRYHRERESEREIKRLDISVIRKNYTKAKSWVVIDSVFQSLFDSKKQKTF